MEREMRRNGRGSSLFLSLMLAACAPEPVPAQDGTFGTELRAFRVDTVVSGLRQPWSMAFLPDGGIVVTEKAGHLRLVRNGALVAEPVAGTPDVTVRGQGGLLDVALHPQFARNRFIYFSYTKGGERGATTAVARGRFDGTRITELQDIFVAEAWSNGGVHFGSRLAFDRDGFLYVTVGDRGAMQEAQDRSNHQGSIMRLHDDGRVPADNPFVGQADVRPEIWSYGHRNPQGLALHPRTGALWDVEHGARGGDELNDVRRGRNYGWPVITYGRNYNGQPIGEGTAKEGMEQPLHYWDPSIATSGLAIYAGDAFPQWRGHAFVGALAGQHLHRVGIDGSRVTGTEKLLERIGRVRDVRVGPDGFIYVLIDASNAPMLRIRPAT